MAEDMCKLIESEMSCVQQHLKSQRMDGENDFQALLRLKIVKSTYHKFLRSAVDGGMVEFTTATAILNKLGIKQEKRIREMLKVFPAHPDPPYQDRPFAWVHPPVPVPFLGREKDVEDITVGLEIVQEGHLDKGYLLALHGTPGIGKSTLAAAIANDATICELFSDAVLWSSFGLLEKGDQHDFALMDRIRPWMSALNIGISDPTLRPRLALANIADALHGKRALIICDDIWSAGDIAPVLNLLDAGVIMIITTRLPSLAGQFEAYGRAMHVEGLKAESCIQLLNLIDRRLAGHLKDKMTELVTDLDFNPLAITAVGHLLKDHLNAGLSITQISGLENAVLNEPLPPYMQQLADEARSQTIATWLWRSVNNLPDHARTCFLMLGLAADKEIVLHRDVLLALWAEFDADAIIRTLVGHGLLTRLSDNTYTMHALMVTLAKNMASGGTLGS